MQWVQAVGGAPARELQDTAQSRQHQRNRSYDAEQILRPAITGKTNSAAKTEPEAELYDIKVKEPSDKDWLRGPLEFQGACGILRNQWLPVRRFCVEQRGKPRPIDDSCENRLNQAISLFDKISLKTMEHVVWAAMIICKLSIHTREMHFTLETGEKLAAKCTQTGREDATSNPQPRICGARTSSFLAPRRGA